MKKVLSYILCDLDPNGKVMGKKAGICDGVPSTAALVLTYLHVYGQHMEFWYNRICKKVSVNVRDG